MFAHQDHLDYPTTENSSEDSITPLLLEYPRVCYRMRVKAKFQERFELQAFPLDAQDLQIEIVSAVPTKGAASPSQSHPHPQQGSEVLLRKHWDRRYQSVVPASTFLLKEEYWLSKYVFVEGSWTDPALSSTRTKYPKLTWSLKITRRSDFYVLYIALPMFLFVSLSFPVSLLPLAALAERLGLFLTLLLSAITYTSLLRDHLPMVSYLTLLDKYVLFCQVLIAAGAFESALVFYALKEDLREPSPESQSLENAHLLRIGDLEDRVIVGLSIGWVVLHTLLYSLRESFSIGALTELERHHGAPLYNNSNDAAVEAAAAFSKKEQAAIDEKGMNSSWRWKGALMIVLLAVTVGAALKFVTHAV